jgi:hypothetical protein
MYEYMYTYIHLYIGNPVTSSSSIGPSSSIDVGDDGGDDIPFMFDDYVTDAPFGDEDFVVERGEKKDDDSVGEGNLVYIYIYIYVYIHICIHIYVYIYHYVFRYFMFLVISLPEE